MHARFVSVVREGRPKLDTSRLPELTTAHLRRAAGAVRRLVDAIGDLRAAIDIAKQAAGVEQARVVRYHRAGETAENIYSKAHGLPAQLNVLPVDLGMLTGPGPRFMYLWAPQLGR